MSPEHPNHYTLPNGKQLLDYVKQLSFPIGNIVKYVYRHREKGGAEDLRKALVYLDSIDPNDLTIDNKDFMYRTNEALALGKLLLALAVSSKHEIADILRPLISALAQKDAALAKAYLDALRANIVRAIRQAGASAFGSLEAWRFGGLE